mmetsp:Transcript_26493/g.46193  ORF Transcript_26493/g.46193 Transcript_26493/m.46193 type:complete len:222 (-) Transcript_26493:439-1104(-)
MIVSLLLPTHLLISIIVGRGSHIIVVLFFIYCTFLLLRLVDDGTIITIRISIIFINYHCCGSINLLFHGCQIFFCEPHILTNTVTVPSCSLGSVMNLEGEEGEGGPVAPAPLGQVAVVAQGRQMLPGLLGISSKVGNVINEAIFIPNTVYSVFIQWPPPGVVVVLVQHAVFPDVPELAGRHQPHEPARVLRLALPAVVLLLLFMYHAILIFNNNNFGRPVV